MTLNAILAREENPPAEVDEPIEWLRLTNTSVQNFSDTLRVIGWYGCRWQIEVYHKILKSGCTVEDCRLEKAERLQNYIALMSVVAWHLHLADLYQSHRPRPALCGYPYGDEVASSL